jgi:two-component system, NtrC family, sensor kinase
MAELDAGQIQQALANLVLNAIQAAAAEGAVRLRIARVQATPPAGHDGREGEYLRLDVEDDGAGMPPEVLDRVFEPFFTTKGVGEGTGLGLSVSHGIVQEHGGWIEARSEPGRGSCFSLYLPCESER